MTIPAKVKKQAEEAEEALDALIAAQSGDDQPVTAAETPSNTQDTLTDATPQPVLAAAPEAPGEPKKDEGKTDADEKVTKLEAKFNVLQGKYNSEIPRFTSRIKELEGQNDSLKDELDAEKAAKPLETDPDAYRRYLSEEEKEDMDGDLLDFQSRLSKGVAEEVATKASKELRGKVDSLQEALDKLNESQEAAKDATFWSKAEVHAPGVTAANTSGDPKWIEFLSGVDPVSRLQYRVIGEAAIERGDAQAVGNLFNLFLEKNKPEPIAPRRTAESQVKPDTSPAAPRATTPPAGQTVLQSEIEAFYHKASQGQVDEAEMAAKEAEFDKAASEGRIAFGK